jgi:hypothetical protein
MNIFNVSMFRKSAGFFPCCNWESTSNYGTNIAQELMPWTEVIVIAFQWLLAIWFGAAWMSNRYTVNDYNRNFLSYK